MPDLKATLPSKPRVVSEDGNLGTYEIENLFPGYGYTLGNALRRVILSSLPGSAITAVKINGASHEFATLDGVKEDVVSILLNLKRIKFKKSNDEIVHAKLSKSGIGKVTSSDIELPGQVELVDKKLPIAEITDKNGSLEMEFVIQSGIGYAPREVLHGEKAEIGMIPLDAIFTSIRRVSYEVENMRVGDRTDFNRLRITIETDGVQTPREALEDSIAIVINQLRAIVGFREEEPLEVPSIEAAGEVTDTSDLPPVEDVNKIKIEDLELSARTANALIAAGIKTVGGLVRKNEEDVLALEGLGNKGLDEIRDTLANHGSSLKNA